jgi:DNA-binding Xre family transcriptional regulator
MMPVINRVPDLLAKKFGGKKKVVVQHVANDLHLTYSTAERWFKNDITRADFPILEKWCEYLDVGIGDILVYVPEKRRRKT